MQLKSLFVLLAGLLIGCVASDNPELAMENEKPETEQPTDPQPNTPPQLKYLALGDSYTIGESVPESGRWPIQLAAKLDSAGYSFDSVRIVARTGWTTGELQSAINRAELLPQYELVSLLIGVNNQYRGVSAGFTLARYAREFEDLLSQAIGFAKGDTARVFVLSIPDWGVTPFAENRDRQQIAQEIDAYNQTAAAICQRLGVRYFDITPISRQATDDPALIAPDKLHPSAKMYAAWVELIADPIMGVLNAE